MGDIGNFISGDTKQLIDGLLHTVNIQNIEKTQLLVLNQMEGQMNTNPSIAEFIENFNQLKLFPILADCLDNITLKKYLELVTVGVEQLILDKKHLLEENESLKADKKLLVEDKEILKDRIFELERRYDELECKYRTLERGKKIMIIGEQALYLEEEVRVTKTIREIKYK